MGRAQLPKRGTAPFTDRRSASRTTRREKLPWPKDRPFKLLSLDGGGIKGIYTSHLLSLIEKEITGGQGIASYFDMVAGTSTGGILAIGIGHKIPAAQIDYMYQSDGHKVFPTHKYKWMPYKMYRAIFGPQYDYKELERLLYEVFKDSTLGDSVARLVIPAFMVPKAEIAVLKTDHHPDFKRDLRMSAWEAARATAAAPTYLRGLEYDGVIFLDGGIWANNPIMVAIVDALSCYDITVDQLDIVSVGTGNSPWHIPLNSARRGMFSWRTVIHGAMYLTTDNALSQARLLVGHDRILRIEPPEEVGEIDMDDWATAVRKLPSAAAESFDVCAETLARLFDEPVGPRHRYYSSESTA